MCCVRQLFKELDQPMRSAANVGSVEFLVGAVGRIDICDPFQRSEQSLIDQMHVRRQLAGP